MKSEQILCIVGKSGSGKTTIAELLDKFGHTSIDSYTTRPPRHPNEKGHIFVSPESFADVAASQGGMVAYTKFDGYEYGATLLQYRRNDVYVIDPSGVKELADSVGRENLIVVYIYAPDTVRYQRMLKTRGEDEAKRRLDHDEKKFAGFTDYDLIFQNVGDTLKYITANLVNVIRTGKVEYIDK